MTADDNTPKICPYPGLRPFTEEESIFFKGRDLHVQQIITQLEEKKFVMLTGASGDGKSSVVYAGVIPNVRAGFFKAKFNKWVFIDFRPERSPLKNMTFSVAKHLGLDQEKVDKRLNSGFSSLIEVYKSSQYYLDTESESFVNLDEKGKKDAKRKAANLFILVDQFEEFFTNNENFSQGKPSLDAQLVVNILLETARIAVDRNLPIYIIFTMRSDFIGQCAAFRGLPEYIGFSQFFVPRLKRKEIYEVIEEPAKMSNNSISRRLLETLIDELRDGFDQLPVLQHALNQIWQKADKGEKEMDLIHLAKLSGLPAKHLPENDQKIFKDWYDSTLANNPDLKEVIEKDFSNPTLENVLNTHANELYSTAVKYYEANHPEGEKISLTESKHIIKIAFQCLTKIDASRAVRIRMTLQEITNIINLPNITPEKVAGVLNTFREQGNTFISPFIQPDNPESRILKLDTVLDITHESLIRNWELLHQWAKEENENWQNFLDFEKQLQRWINSDKSTGYLLPIGPLTFFENWFNRCKPNKYWLVKYDESDRSIEEKLKVAEETVKNAKEFLRKSALRLIVSRTVLKYGAQRIATAIGFIFLITAITYYTFDFRRKQNDYVLNDITKKGLFLLKSNKVSKTTKANFIINHERLHPGSAESILNSINNDTLAYDIAYEGFSLVQNYDNKSLRKVENPFANRLIIYMDSVLYMTMSKNNNSIEKNISRVNNLMKLCIFIKFNNKSKIVDHFILKNIQFIEKYINSTVANPEGIKIEEFNTGIEILLTSTDYDKEKIKSLLQKISPYVNQGISNFNKIYPKTEKIRVDNLHYLSHRGGYQILSYLYSAIGDYSNLARSLDSLIKSNREYRNHSNGGIEDICFYLLKYKDFPSAQSEDYMNKYLKYFGKVSKIKAYEHLISLIRNLDFNFELIYGENNDSRYYTGLIRYIAPNENIDRLWDYCLKLIENSDWGINEKNINIALYYKKRGDFEYNKRKNPEESSRFFAEAFKTYRKIPADFLNQNYVFYQESGEINTSASQIKNSVAFLYPHTIYQGGENPLDFLYHDYVGNCFPFFEYVINNKLDYLYNSEDDYKSLEKFIYDYLGGVKFNLLDQNPTFQINYNYLNIIDKIISKSSKADQILNKNFVTLMMINKAFDDSDTALANNLYKKLDIAEIEKIDFQKQEEPRAMVNKELLKEFAKNLAINNRLPESFIILKALKEPWDRRNCLIDITNKLQETGPIENTFIYLDSLFTEVERIPKYGTKLFCVLGLIGSQPVYNITMNLYKDIDEKLKPRAFRNFIEGVANSNSYYKAFSIIPEYTSSVNQLDLFNVILHAEVIKIEKNRSTMQEDKIWELYDSKIYGELHGRNYEYEQEHFELFPD